MKTIITISRQYGSGGREIGKRLAEDFGIPFYDNELIAIAAKKANYNEEDLKKVDEKAARFWEYSGMFLDYLPEDQNPFSYLPMNDQLFHMQKEIIQEAAKQGPCVIVGRCADDILSDDPNAVHIFVQASMDKRIERIRTMHDLTEKKAKDTIVKMDKSRAAYYNYYTNRKWGTRDYYDLVIRSDRLGIEDTTHIIADFVKLHQNKTR